MAAATAVGVSIGIANGMALAANSEIATTTSPPVIRQVVVPEVQPIVVVIPRSAVADPTVTPRPATSVAVEAPPPPAPPAVQAPAPQPVTESSGS